MREDVERIYAANIRLASEAYDLLLNATIHPAVLSRILRSYEPIVGVDFIRSCMAEEAKIPSPEKHWPAKEKAGGKKQETTPASMQEPPPAPVQKQETQKAEEQQAPQVESQPTTQAQQAPQVESQPTTQAPPAPQLQQAPPAPQAPRQDSFPAPEKPIATPQEQFPSPRKAEEKYAPEFQKESEDAPKPDFVQEAEVQRRKSFRPVAAEYSPRITIFEKADVSGQSRCTGTVEDFVAHFRDRFERISQILRQRPGSLPIVRTDQLNSHKNEAVRLICMISEKRITAKGNLMLELEDEQGRVRSIISSKENCFSAAKTILKDDIVAVDGKMGDDWFIAKEVTWPDLPIMRKQKKAEVDVAVVYLSDLHVGSRYFLEKPFRKFMRWLCGEEGNAELAGKVKYVVMAGDICDGIGVYPLQEKELVVKDIYEQYAMFDSLVQHFPDHIVTVVGPGNHDAVRRGEPQPYIPMDMIKSDVKKIGSPATLEIEGLKHLVYHGTSIDSIIANIAGLSYANPDGPMVELLRRRHLSPIYGENLIVPEHRDYMLIEDEPDVVHMGHIHKNAARKYNGTLLINSGTFQERTEFQVKMGHIPTPGIVPVLELASGNLSHLNFMGD